MSTAGGSSGPVAAPVEREGGANDAQDPALLSPEERKRKRAQEKKEKEERERAKKAKKNVSSRDYAAFALC